MPHFAECPCLLYADWSLEFDAVSNSGLQAGEIIEVSNERRDPTILVQGTGRRTSHEYEYV